MTRSQHNHPRAVLMSGATPLERLPRLSDALGLDLWIKRDDLAGVSFGGNKTRQLEFYLGAAQAADADTILITGAVQSNFVRTAAASAAKLGMHTIVQLEDRVPGMDAAYATSGNVMLSELLGAEIMRYPEGEDEDGADAALHARAEALRVDGKKPFVIPLGLNNKPLGALGYMRCANEILAQDDGFDAIVVASGSGLTHAGLLAGLRVAGHDALVTGSCVRRPEDQQYDRIQTVLGNIETLIQRPTGVTDADVHLWDAGLAPGYGRIGPAAMAMMSQMARQEGIILDPVYTAKACAAIPALLADGTIRKGARVLFIHTGGLPAVFAYEHQIRAGLAERQG